MRGRNRKGPNPLTRSYESNGPDVKIRGTAHHIAEKYLSLARDAQSSGDRVAAESYLQHAEHYFRIIAAAQQQFAQQSPQMMTPDQPFPRNEEDDFEEDPQNDRFYSNLPPQFPQQNQANGNPYRNGDGQNNHRDGQPFVNGSPNGSEGQGRGEQQPPQGGERSTGEETGFGGEPPAFVGGGGDRGGGYEQNFGNQNFNNNQQGGEGGGGGGYRRRRRSGRDRPRYQDRGGDNNPPQSGNGGGGEGGGGSED
jgi:hypothetical protein